MKACSHLASPKARKSQDVVTGFVSGRGYSEDDVAPAYRAASLLSVLRREWAKPCCINDRPQMNDPAKQKIPENARKHEMHQGHPQAALHELSQPRDEETTDGGNHIPGRTLACHEAILLLHGGA
jgi:hypothetical protein